MRHGTVGRLAREFDHLLALVSVGLADHRLVLALLAQLAQRAGRLFFVGVGEQGIGAADCLAWITAAEKSTWPESVEMSATTLRPASLASSGLMRRRRPPLPKSLFT